MTITDPTPINGTVFVTDMLVNSTVVLFNTSFCNFGESVYTHTHTHTHTHTQCEQTLKLYYYYHAAIVEPEIQNAGMTIMLSFEVFLLALAAALLVNSTKP